MAPAATQTNVVEDVSYKQRRLPKQAQGVYAFAMFERKRAPGFLTRNIKQIEEFHQKQCQAQDLIQNGQKSNTAKPLAHLQKTTCNSAAHSTEISSSTSRERTNVLTEDTPNGIPEDSRNVHTMAVEAMSRRTLLAKDKNKQIRRVSSRHLTKQEDDDAVLSINMYGMRKKLNFKDNVKDGPRPSKRARPDMVLCFVYLSIWDNSPGQSRVEPLYSNRRDCYLVLDDREDVGAGRILELRLEDPFEIRRKDLKVGYEQNGELKSRLAERYFLEFKIALKEKGGSNWPPFKILGKSDGDQQAKIDEKTKEEVDQTLVARQHELLTEPGKALSLFFFAEGRSFRTKYALQIETEWKSLETLSRDVKTKKETFEPWMLDDDKNPFGNQSRKVIDTKKTQATSRAARKSTVVLHPQPPPEPEPLRVKWAYELRKSLPDGAKRKYREFVTRGIVCYICVKAFKTPENLLFHMERAHDSFNYEFEGFEEVDGIQRGFTIAINDKPMSRFRGENEALNDKCFDWEAPTKPLNLEAHTMGDDRSWLGVLAPPKSKKSVDQRKKEIVQDPRAAERASKGYVSFQMVAPFRPGGKTRKKYKAYTLIHKRPLQNMGYSSLAHRPLPAHIDDDQMSDSDDEANDTYLADRWAQDWDQYAFENSWPDAKRRVYKKWGYYVFHKEQTPHPKYASDTLIRFVRQERRWLLRRGPRWDGLENRSDLEFESIAALDELMLELVEGKSIDSSVCKEVLSILETDNEVILPLEECAEDPSTDKASDSIRLSKLAKEEEDRVQRLRETHKMPSTDICDVCDGKIDHEKRRALRCSITTCKQPDKWYHASCVGFALITQRQLSKSRKETNAVVLEKDFMSRRKSWKCLTCDPK